MFYFLIDLIPLNNTIVIKEDNTTTTCIVVETDTEPRFGSDRFGKVKKPSKEIICY